ncbi:MAG: SBBP repeat-containing protein, partial [Verrucomicrobia subdivision 3 bacterium]|nr:SBBP repeat-containing protein [Limisphaerales bacterium]
ALKVVADTDGNAFVVGFTDDGTTGADMLIIKYSRAGIPLWTNRYDGHYPDGAAVDKSGNVFVTGSSAGSGGNDDYATIAYSGAGVALWTNHYNGPANGYDRAAAISVANDGNVFVTGYSDGSAGNKDYATIAYSAAGLALWTNQYNGPGNDDDFATSITVDGSGNVLVTGLSIGIGADWDYATIAYSGAGVPLWTNFYNGLADRYDQAYAVAVDDKGRVFVTGYSIADGGDYDYATIAYSAAGVALWTNRYNGPGNDDDFATALTVDSSGNVFVTGFSDGIGGHDYTTIAYSGAGVALWTNRYNGPGNTNDFARAVATDSSGNVFVTGYSFAIEGYDYATIAYAPTGVALWTNRYNGPGNDYDFASAVAVNTLGDIFVTGLSRGSGGNDDYATLAYSGAGVALWTNRYDGPGNSQDQVSALAVDSAGNVFVTGSLTASGGNSDYMTLAYSSAGVALWTNRYDGGGDDQAYAVAVDSNGNVFVTGSSSNDYATIAYSERGVALWTNRFKGPGNSLDQAVAMIVDYSGNVFVTGSSAGDYATIAYSGAGVALWTNLYDGARHDQANAVAVDHNGNVFVAGSSVGPASSFDYVTIAYSGVGVALWTNRYDGARHDEANAVAVDHNGNVFVTGASLSIGSYDYATIAYSSTGGALWTNRYNGPANGDDQPGMKSCLAIGADGGLYVAGSSDGSYNSSTILDFATIKYVWQTQLAIQPLMAGSSTVNLTLSGAPNSSWSIERAVRISGPWTNLGPCLIATNGPGLFQDANPPAKGAFYRATQP